MGQHRLRGIGLILLSASAFGAMPILARIAYESGIDAPTLLFLRFAIAAATMLLIAFVRRVPLPRGRTLLQLALLGGVGYVGQSISFFTALTLAPAALVSLLLYLYPALVTLLAAIFLKERLTASRIVALLLAVGGSILTIGGAQAGKPLGIVLGVVAAMIYAVFIIVSGPVTARAGALASSTVIICAAALVYAAATLVRGGVGPVTSRGLLAIVALALISTVTSIVTFFAGLKSVGPTAAAMLSTFEPVVTVTLAAIVLHERLRSVQIAGAVLIIAAVLLIAARPVAPRQVE